MKYLKNTFLIEKKNIRKLANRFGTPLYCYSYNKLRKNIIDLKLKFKSVSPLICFAVKSNSNLRLLKEIKRFGIGADVVSKGEMMKALKAGINPKKIVFSGVGKTPEEIDFAIQKKILLINAESESEILEIEKIAKKRKKRVNIGIRLNPNTDAKTLKQISTGKKENKFGVDEKIFIKLVDYLKNSNFINLSCLSVHIGSQILENKPYEKMLIVVNKLLSKINHHFEYIDLGGGMGIKYQTNDKNLNYEKYCQLIRKFKKLNKCKIIFEPGRSIIGNAGVLITKIIHLKENKNKTFVILDAGMNDLMRPALYGAKHRIIPEIKRSKKYKKIYEFVGPICETTDSFMSSSNFQKLIKNDLLVILDTGAYGYSLSSNYNVRPKPPEILIKNNSIKLIQKKQKLENLL